MRMPIGIVLATAMGLTLAVATGGTIAYLRAVATGSALELISDKGRLTLDRATATVEGAMRQVRDQAAFLARVVETAEDPSDPADRVRAVAPQILGSTQLVAGLIVRNPEGGSLAIDRNGIETAGIDLTEPIAEPGWRSALTMPAGGPLGLPYAQPLDGGGSVSVLLDLEALSDLLGAAVGEDAQISFLLAGDAAVLAHSDATRVRPGTALGPQTPDPVLNLIAHPNPMHRPIPMPSPAFLDAVDGRMFSVFHRTLAPSTAGPLIAGVYYEASDLGAPGDEIDIALYVSAGLLVLVVIGAFLLGNHIGRPVRKLAAVAKRMETLSVHDAPRLPRSNLREVDDANQAVNAAIGGLDAFSRYVPRELVLRLLRPGAIGATESTTREVTILFTDIAGYTATAGRLSAEETASFLNHHFELLTACVEAEGGTVDKFIGDSLMAFWGAPEAQPDHLERAVRAVHAMAEAFRSDEAMQAIGVRLRIGLHMGPVVVGNIGATSRTSYTVIGDAVNVAARLEQLGKQIAPDADVIALTSAEANARLPADLQGQAIGRHRLRGRDEETEVVRLV